MLIVITRDMKLTVRLASLHRLGAPVVVRGCREAFNLQRLGYRHEGLKLGLLHVDFTLVHELQKLSHDGKGHVFEYDWNVRRAEMRSDSCLWKFRRSQRATSSFKGKTLLLNVR
jgi:hypothetical protein